MTADHNISSSSDNSGDQSDAAAANTANVEQVLRCLREREHAPTREELAMDLQYPIETLDAVLDGLERRDIVTVERGAMCDLVQLLDDDSDSEEPRKADCQHPRPIVGTIDLSVVGVFNVLDSMRRRTIVRLLASETLPSSRREVPITTLAKYLAAEERDIPRSEVTVRQTTYLGSDLLQTHLPILDDLGVVEWDEYAYGLQPTESVEQLAALLDLIEAACSDE